MCQWTCTVLVAAFLLFGKCTSQVNSTQPGVMECKPDNVNLNDQCNQPLNDHFYINLRNKSICANGYNESAKNQIDTLFQAFNQSQVVDLVIIVDRSRSIQCNQFQCAKELLVQMVNHLVRGGYMAIGPDHTRVTLISFGITVTVEYDGISDHVQAKNLNSCNFGSKIVEKVYPTDGSQVGSALETAVSTFEKGKGYRSNKLLKQIMIIATDGESTDSEGDSVRQNSVNRLKNAGVEIFTIGQDGGWFDVKERENSVINMASSLNHYACRYVWSQGFNQRPLPSVPPVAKGSESRSDYAQVDVSELPSVPGPCQPENNCTLDCACHIKKIQYVCYDFPETTTTSTTTTRLPTITPAPTLPWWFKYAVGGAIGGLVLLLIIIIIVCCVCCRNKRRRSYPGPPRPTPPIPRRPKPFHKGYDNVYGNVQTDLDDYQDIPQISQVTMEHTYTSDPVEDTEHDLPEWAGYLKEEMMLQGFLHLGVHNMAKERWSMTPGIKVTRKEVREIDKMFLDNDLKKKVDIKLGGKRYRLELNESSEGDQIVATRKAADSGDQTDVAVVVKEERYLVVGIASVDHRQQLISQCRVLSSHFQDIYGV